MSQSEDRPAGGPADSGFVFGGGALALDLVNTEVVIRGRPRDLMAIPDDLSRWWAWAAEASGDRDRTVVLGRPLRFDAALLEATRRLRAALRAVFTAVVGDQPPPEDDLAALNQALARGYERLVPAAGGQLQSVYDTGEDPAGPLLLPIARSAVRLLTEVDRGRLHRCRNPRCVLFFYDATRSATRQWCSLACMDRARSVARYRLTRAEAGAQAPEAAAPKPASEPPRAR